MRSTLILWGCITLGFTSPALAQTAPSSPPPASDAPANVAASASSDGPSPSPSSSPPASSSQPALVVDAKPLRSSTNPIWRSTGAAWIATNYTHAYGISGFGGGMGARFGVNHFVPLAGDRPTWREPALGLSVEGGASVASYLLTGGSGTGVVGYGGFLGTARWRSVLVGIGGFGGMNVLLGSSDRNTIVRLNWIAGPMTRVEFLFGKGSNSVPGLFLVGIESRLGFVPLSAPTQIVWETSLSFGTCFQ